MTWSDTLVDDHTFPRPSGRKRGRNVIASDNVLRSDLSYRKAFHLIGRVSAPHFGLAGRRLETDMCVKCVTIGGIMSRDSGLALMAAHQSIVVARAPSSAYTGDHVDFGSLSGSFKAPSRRKMSRSVTRPRLLSPSALLLIASCSSVWAACQANSTLWLSTRMATPSAASAGNISRRRFRSTRQSKRRPSARSRRTRSCGSE